MNETVTTRPWTVTLACATSLAVSVWEIATLFQEEMVEGPGFLILLIVLSAIPIIFTLAAFLRRNWGRIVLAVISALGVVSVPLAEVLAEELVVPLDAETVLYVLASAAVAVALFLPASNEWYRKPREQAA